MKSLIITAHPSTTGFTHKIADTYTKTIQKNNGEVILIDLYNDNKYQQDFLVFDDVKGKWNNNESRTLIQKHIMWADELIFIYPTWWSSMPAIMKNFIDNNFTAGFAFSYESGRPKGLLQNKTVRIFTTADAPKIMYTLLKPLLKITVARAIFGFCGMKVKSFDIFTNMGNKKDDSYRKALLAKVASHI